MTECQHTPDDLEEFSTVPTVVDGRLVEFDGYCECGAPVAVLCEITGTKLLTNE